MASIACGTSGCDNWQRLAAELHLDDARLIDGFRAMAQAIPDQAAAVLKQVEGLSYMTIKRLTTD